MNTDSDPYTCKECGKKYDQVLGYDPGTTASQPVVVYLCVECSLKNKFLDKDASDG